MSETGHARNIDGASKFITILTSWAADYNPAKPALQLPQFTLQVAQAETLQEAYLDAKRANLNDKNTRRAAFAPLQKFATRVLNALKASDATEGTIADAEGYIRKLRGKRAKKQKGQDPAPSADLPPVSPAHNEDHQHSVAQLSFSSLIEHLKGLQAITATEPSYAPNEADLTATAIAALIAHLTALNKAEDQSYTACSNARNARNESLYAPKTGILDTVESIKAYTKSRFGATSPELKQLTYIKFKDITE